jgi:hypothetical protein
MRVFILSIVACCLHVALSQVDAQGVVSEERSKPCNWQVP